MEAPVAVPSSPATMAAPAETPSPAGAISSSPTLPQACLPPTASPAQAAQSTPQPGPRITQQVIALDEAGTRLAYMVPGSPQAIYAAWKVEGVSGPIEVQAKWIAEEVGGITPETVLATSTRTVAQDGAGAFPLARPAAGWTPGRYRVEVSAGSGGTQVSGFVISAPVVSSPGVVTRYFADHSYNVPRKTAVAQTLALEWSAPPVVPLEGSKFWVEWEGVLTPPAAGRYEFRFEGDGVGFLYLDGQRVIPDRSRTVSESLMLDARPYTIRLGAIEEAPRGRVALQWKQAQDRDYSQIDPRYVSHTAAQREWRRNSRQAAQVGLEWLQSESVAWQRRTTCFGCHVQGQVIMGLSVARANGYVVSEDHFQELVQFTRKDQNVDGSYGRYQVTATVYAAMGLTFVDQLSKARQDDTLLKAVAWLLDRQRPDGEVPPDHIRPPIDQGSIMTAANSVVAFSHAAAMTGDARFRRAADCALTWIASSPAETNQDRTLKVIALSRFGSEEQRRIAAEEVDRIEADQRPDGGWRESNAKTGGNAFATGEALCALQEAGVSVDGAVYQKGVRFLLKRQMPGGPWPREHTESVSDFVHTMWPVICLAGTSVSIAPEPTGQLRVVSAAPRAKTATKNLEIVLDLSGSMLQPLGKSTRWQTALQVFRQVLAKLPDDFNVGLRVYGHRLPASASQTCTDTELLVPIGKLDRGRLSSSLNRLRPRGETPLVYSVLQAAADLKALGGGSVILITDGEESCKGDPVKAGAQLRAAGFNVTLNIVGFTLKGPQVERPLTAFAQATGGRYYGAASGEALARALLIAAVEGFPYKVFDAAGRLVAKGEAGALTDDLPPGDYKVVVQAADQVLVAGVKVVAGRSTVVKVALKDGRFVLER